MRVRLLCLSVALLMFAAPLSAQQNGDTPQAAPPKLDPKACADREQLELGDTHEPQGKNRETTGDNPSDKLARTDGVLCPPPHLDPDIRTPAPGGGQTPVLPPPTEDDPDTRPK